MFFMYKVNCLCISKNYLFLNDIFSVSKSGSQCEPTSNHPLKNKMKKQFQPHI